MTRAGAVIVLTLVTVALHEGLERLPALLVLVLTRLERSKSSRSAVVERGPISRARTLAVIHGSLFAAVPVLLLTALLVVKGHAGEGMAVLLVPLGHARDITLSAAGRGVDLRTAVAV